MSTQPLHSLRGLPSGRACLLRAVSSCRVRTLQTRVVTAALDLPPQQLLPPRPGIQQEGRSALARESRPRPGVRPRLTDSRIRALIPALEGLVGRGLHGKHITLPESGTVFLKAQLSCPPEPPPTHTHTPPRTRRWVGGGGSRLPHFGKPV